MRIALAVVVLAVVGGCNQSSGASGSSGGGAATKTATSADCVTKLMSINPGSGDPEKKLFTSMCDNLTADQRGCIVAATAKGDVDKCVPNQKLK